MLVQKEPRNVVDKIGMELFTYAQKKKVRENFEKLSAPHMARYEKVSDVSIKDVMVHVARYGGRVEVQGFGTFFVAEIEQRPKIVNGNFIGMRSARRVITFKSSALFRDMCNQNYFNQTVPEPNAEYFIEKRNILI
jgi:nucleoid DNA-binding protein